MLRIAINGYGRIGRCLVRALFERDLQRKIHLCAINDLGDPATLAHLTRFDSTFGRFAGQVDLQGDLLQIADPVRKLVRFRRLNLLGDWPFTKAFNVIFCSLPGIISTFFFFF